MNTKSRNHALLGVLAADALAMPVHWYYDRGALVRDYGRLSGYVAPKSSHPDSILWRSSYTPLNERGEILHDQARYWGQRGVHYHQFLAAGQNTLNFQLAVELYDLVSASGGYDAEAWLEHYISFMLDPTSHRDTYLEEYHRDFFRRYSRGMEPLKCGGSDLHIGGLSHVAALFAALPESGDELVKIIRGHVALTHDHPELLDATVAQVRIMNAVEAGMSLREAILRCGGDRVSASKFEKWLREPDDVVIGKQLSPACYIRDAFPAALYLSWKYADDFEAGIVANAMVGGDNCHRGAVVGALLGQACGVPDRWVRGLVRVPGFALQATAG